MSIQHLVAAALSGNSQCLVKTFRRYNKLLELIKKDRLFEDDILKKRSDAKLDKNSIFEAMFSYAKYGPKNPLTNILSEKELRALKPEDLISVIKSLTTYNHRVLCCSSDKPEEIAAILNKHHNTPEQLKPIPAETKSNPLETSFLFGRLYLNVTEVEIDALTSILT